MKRKHVIVVGVIAVLVVAAYYFYGGSTVPSGQQPLVRLNGSNLSSLKDTFNQSADSVRVLVLVSPA